MCKTFFENCKMLTYWSKSEASVPCPVIVHDIKLSKLAEIWRTYGGQVRTAGHLADTCFTFGPNSLMIPEYQRRKNLKKII